VQAIHQTWANLLAKLQLLMVWGCNLAFLHQ